MNTIVRRIGYAVLLLIGVLFAVNLAMPYGNHLMMAWNVGHEQKNVLERVVFWPLLSRAIIKMRGISCDLPIVTIPLNIAKVQHVPSDKTAISAIAAIYNAYAERIDVEQKLFMLKHLKDTIEKCDPNQRANGIPPIIDAILTRQPDIVSALVTRGANVNAIVVRNRDGLTKRYTPLHFAEVVHEKAKDNESKQAYAAIIDRLKQAGAHSEYSETTQNATKAP